MRPLLLLLLALPARGRALDWARDPVPQMTQARRLELRDKKSDKLAARIAEFGPVPGLPKGTGKEYYKPFQDAFLKAVERLRKPKCAAFFGDGAEAQLRSAEYRFLDLGAPSLTANGDVKVTGAMTVCSSRPCSIFINTSGPFVTQVRYVAGKSGLQVLDLQTGLRGADFGALFLLHELGHVVGKFGPDADDWELNRSYSMQVRGACF